MACTGCGGLQRGDVGLTLRNQCFCGTPTFSEVAMNGNPQGIIPSLTGCVDAIRDIKTQLGARQYEVALVWTQWTGGARGVGEESIVREIVLRPTPEIADISEITRQNTQVGLDEVGQLQVSEISPRFSEDFLLGRFEGLPLPEDQNFYWEIETPPRPDGVRIRRRFFPVAVPNLEETRFQWTVALTKASQDREIGGDPRG